MVVKSATGPGPLTRKHGQMLGEEFGNDGFFSAFKESTTVAVNGIFQNDTDRTVGSKHTKIF